jgi:hypothetical protein
MRARAPDVRARARDARARVHRRAPAGRRAHAVRVAQVRASPCRPRRPAAHRGPHSMRLAAGPSVKSALSHTWTLDTRDARIGTRAGAYSRLTTELAGGPVLRGDAGFVRAEAEHALGRGVPGTSGMARASFCLVLRRAWADGSDRRGLWACARARSCPCSASRRCSPTASSSAGPRACACSARTAWGPATAVRAPCS